MSKIGRHVALKWIRYMFLALIAALNTSCSMFSPVKVAPSTTYVLNKVPQPVTKKPTRQISVLVTQPMTDNIYGTSQMVYSTRPYQISYFAKNRWAEPPAQMLQSLMIQTLQKTHYFHAVSPALGNYDFILNSQLIELRQVFFANRSYVHLTVRTQIVSTTTNNVLASKEFSIVQPAPQSSPYGGAVAANYAMANLLNQWAYFCLHRM